MIRVIRNAWRRSLARRWLIVQGVMLVLVLGAAALGQYRLLAGSVQNDVAAIGHSVTETIIGFTAVNPAWMEGGTLQEVVSYLAIRVPSIERVAVIHRTRGTVADSGSETDDGLNRDSAVASALAGDRVPDVVLGNGHHRRVVRITRAIEGPYDESAGSAITGVVLVHVDLARSEGRVRSVLWRSAAALAAALSAIWAFQIVILRRLLLARLSRMGRVVARFGAGDLSARVDTHLPDELGAVARSFDEMAARVQESIGVRHEAERMKADFVSFASHQLRTPLTGMNWMLELAADAPGLPAAARTYLDDARHSAARLVTLVNDLLKVSRFESGGVDAVIRSVDLTALTRQALSGLAPQIAHKTHVVQFDPRSPVPDVAADADLLREAITNLVSNAVKYTPPGGRITVDVGAEDGHVRWAVTDTGIGVPAAQQDRLFEKFFRADNAAAVEGEGTGLGLSFARLVVQRFGGRIWCESEEGRGSTFAFTLPVTRAGEEPT